MKLVLVSLAVFYKKISSELWLWTQTRTEGGPFEGLWEFPGGGIEPGETPLLAAVREVEEEVGIKISPQSGKFFGTYTHHVPGREILLYVTLFPAPVELDSKGQWLRIIGPDLSSPYLGKIPSPNHKMIDDLFFALISSEHDK